MHYFKQDLYPGYNLYQYNLETKVYRLRTTLEKVGNVFSQEQFDSLNCVKIKKTEFRTLLNSYFNSIKDSWEYLGIEYRKLDNFEYDKSLDGFWKTSGITLADLPEHNITNNCNWTYQIVWHQGNLYYAFTNSNYFPQVQLFDFKTNQSVKWTNIKNLAPVFNVTDKKLL